MNSKELRALYEAYQQVNAPQEVDEATAMTKRGYDETKLRQRAGGGEAADRASSLEKKSTFGDANKAKQRQNYARAQRGDFRKTASSNPGLQVGQHKSDDPTVKAKQAARGAQRGALTPNERKQLNMGDETFDVFDIVLEFLQAEGFAETLEEAEWMMANMIDEEAIGIILGEGEKPFPLEKVKAKQVALRDKGGNALDRRMKMGMAVRRAKEAEKTGGSQRDAGKGWYHAKEEFELWVDALVEEGYDLSDYSWDEMYEFYLDEAITSEKGKAKASEMIAKRTTASGRAKSGKGANVAQIKHIQRSNRDGLGGTPPNRKTAGSNWPKSYSGIGGSGNKAARRAAALKNEEFVGESQEARNNPEKYEREQSKKYAPVRGERTPMPPRGDKRREDFEKWYAKNVR
jgi:hypothetical protein